MKTKYFSTTVGRLAYTDEGMGQLVICLPGMGDTKEEYRFLAPKLVAAGFRVVCLDQRGQGESSSQWNSYLQADMSQDVIDLIGHLNQAPAVIIGTSMGAGIGVFVAGSKPELVSKLVLMGPFVRDVKPITWLTKIMYTTLFSSFWGASSWGMYFKTLFPKNKPEDLQEYTKSIITNLQEKSRLTALRGMLLASKKESEMLLPKVKAPSLIVMGDCDPDFKNPVEEAEFISSKLPSQIVISEGSGHYPQVDNPEFVSQKIIDFLQNS